jgi:hypothetical protein
MMALEERSIGTTAQELRGIGTWARQGRGTATRVRQETNMAGEGRLRRSRAHTRVSPSCHQAVPSQLSIFFVYHLNFNHKGTTRIQKRHYHRSGGGIVQST